jgi:hypothetical protein
MKCYYRLYDECIYEKETKERPSYKECSLCIKVYRLKNGLVTIVKAKGLRTGITL